MGALAGSSESVRLLNKFALCLCAECLGIRFDNALTIAVTRSGCSEWEREFEHATLSDYGWHSPLATEAFSFAMRTDASTGTVWRACGLQCLPSGAWLVHASRCKK